MNIKIKKVRQNAILPTRGSDYAAGYDLYVSEIRTPNCPRQITIQPQTSVKFGAGVAAAIPEGYFGAVYARSGLATKRGLRLSNDVGIIDADYRGEIIVSLHNDSNEPQKINIGDRIAQLIIQPFEAVEWEETSELDDTKRGEGGFGSTGRK